MRVIFEDSKERSLLYQYQRTCFTCFTSTTVPALLSSLALGEGRFRGFKRAALVVPDAATLIEQIL